MKNKQQEKMYVNDYNGAVITPEVHHSIMMLIKVLFKFDIINAEQAIEIASKFKIFFV